MNTRRALFTQLSEEHSSFPQSVSCQGHRYVPKGVSAERVALNARTNTRGVCDRMCAVHVPGKYIIIQELLCSTKVQKGNNALGVSLRS